jgi:hypothetical protein
MAISPLDKSISVDVAGAAARIDEVSEVEINGAQLHYRLSVSKNIQSLLSS